MGRSMKDFGRMIKNMDKEGMCGRMVITMRVNTKRIGKMVMVLNNLVMELGMKDILRTMKSMERDALHGQMAIIMMVIIAWAISMERENTNGKMVAFMKENG